MTDYDPNEQDVRREKARAEAFDGPWDLETNWQGVSVGVLEVDDSNIWHNTRMTVEQAEDYLEELEAAIEEAKEIRGTDD